MALVSGPQGWYALSGQKKASNRYLKTSGKRYNTFSPRKKAFISGLKASFQDCKASQSFLDIFFRQARDLFELWLGVFESWLEVIKSWLEVFEFG